MQFSLSTVFYVVLFIAFLTLRNLCQKQWCLTFHGILNENSLLYLKPLSPYVLSRGHGVQPWSVLETNPHTFLFRICWTYLHVPDLLQQNLSSSQKLSVIYAHGPSVHCVVTQHNLKRWCLKWSSNGLSFTPKPPLKGKSVQRDYEEA